MNNTSISFITFRNKVKHSTLSLKRFGSEYVHSEKISLNIPQGKIIAMPGTPGSGAGKGGGAGGSVRESGGGLGQYGAAQEEGFFYKKQKELLKKLKEKAKKTPKSEEGGKGK